MMDFPIYKDITRQREKCTSTDISSDICNDYSVIQD